jgi:hypothetical protein
MPLTWIEDSDSRSATIVRLGKKAGSSYVKSYKVFGTTDDVALHADINAYVSSTLRGWQYPGTSVQLLAESYSVSYLGDDAWQVQINYAKDGADDEEQEDPLKRSRSFDTSGGTQHITQARGGAVTVRGTTTVTESTETKYPPGDAPSMDSAIGVDGDSVAGVDIVVPQLTWTETYDVPSAYVTNAYIKDVAALTGTVNNAAFRSFAAGEVLFLGASGSHEWDDEKGFVPWSLSYKFVASSNVTNETIGSITGIDKKGHEYLWVRYEDAVDGSASVAFKRPKYVYINKVYRDGSFASLGIGTT